MLHTIHRVSACLLTVFIVAHLANHVVAMQGIEAHIAFMDLLRAVYRHPVAEVLLLVSVLIQVGTGVYFIKNRWGQRQGFYDRLQAISGAYLAFFLLNHIAAMLFGRIQLNLDTNFYYGAAGFHVTPFQYFFAPYYFLAIVAIFAHMACATHWLTRHSLSESSRNQLSGAVILLGALLALFIIFTFSGGFYPVDIPSEYRATYGG